MSAMLSATDITTGFGDYQILWGPSFQVEKGQIVALLGPNGSGKSTLMATASGVLMPWSGVIHLDGDDVTTMPAHERAALGLCHVLERRRLFNWMSVRENLILGASMPHAKVHRKESEELAYSLFPILKERQRQHAGSLSGGEQQMLAIARGLMTRPKMLLLDEPLLGLSPSQVQIVSQVIARLRADGMTILMVEQNVSFALNIADRCVLLRSGEVMLEARSEQLDEDIVLSVYTGGDPNEVLRGKQSESREE